MIRRTLAQMRTHLARLAAVSGLDAASVRFTELFNLGTEELLHERDFPQAMVHVRFKINQGMFTLPHDLERAAGMVIDDVPVMMPSPWMEYLQWGTGLLDGEDGNFIAVERDYIPVHTQLDDSVGHQIRVRSEVNEDVSGTTPTITIRGYDQNGEWVRTDDGAGRIDGEKINIQTTNNYSVTLFSRITEVVKPQTKDMVRLFDLHGGETEIAQYRSFETVPNYKRYLVPSLVDDGSQEYTVQVRAKRAFIPVENDDDVVIFANIAAMRAMLKSIHAADTSDGNDEVFHKNRALLLMEAEAKHMRGKTKTPGLSCDKGEGNYVEDIR